MRRLERFSPLVTLGFALAGVAAGFLVQFARSAAGLPPLVPPGSLPATLVLLAAIILVLAILLRRAVTRTSRRAVNPFHAVRLLAAARAGQGVGALCAGFGTGLALQLLTRSVAASAETWVPTVLAVAAGLALLVAGVIAEALCRVPHDPEVEGEGDDEASAGDAPGLRP